MTASTISAIVTAFERIDKTTETINRLVSCIPRPDEILVHVDGNQVECESAIRESFPFVRVLLSNERVGPGGGRNKLIAAASHEIVASFDDDSYPLVSDYFARLLQLFSHFPEAAIITGRVFHRNESQTESNELNRWVADFCGGACAYRRNLFLKTDGYVSLPTAYGMEEVDLAIRSHASGARVLQSDRLRVYHDTDLRHHSSAAITSSSISNLALLAFLRYPVIAWPVGLLQIANRIIWLGRHRRYRGIIGGVLTIPRIIYRQRKLRSPVTLPALRSYWALRRSPVVASTE